MCGLGHLFVCCLSDTQKHGCGCIRPFICWLLGRYTRAWMCRLGNLFVCCLSGIQKHGYIRPFICWLLVRYTRAWMWMDRTIAHGLHFVAKKSEFVGALCGGLGGETFTNYGQKDEVPRNLVVTIFGYSVKLWSCKFTRTDVRYQLCKVDSPVNEPGERSASRIQSPRLYDTLSNSTLITCPLNHTTQSFLACDVHSACWARSSVTYGTDKDNWDIPAYSTCPAGVSPLPPSYACASGGGRLPYTFVCDHQQDCRDNSDEEFCVYPDCRGENGLQCGNIRQVCVTVHCYCRY